MDSFAGISATANTTAISSPNYAGYIAANTTTITTASAGSYWNRDFYSSFYQNLSRVSKFPALLSILASLFILQDILRSTKKRRRMTNQIMMGLCLADIGFALTHFVGTWAAPKGQVYGARGTITTCTLQGYVNVCAYHTGGFFNAALALVYVLMVRYGWTEDSFQKSVFGMVFCGKERNLRLKWILLIVPIILGHAVAAPGVPKQNYNYTGQWLCSGGPWPVGCNDLDRPCERGDSMVDMFHETGCFVMCFWVSVLCGTIILGSMLCLYYTVLQNERAMDKYQFQNHSSFSGSGSRGSSNNIQTGQGESGDSSLASDCGKGQETTTSSTQSPQPGRSVDDLRISHRRKIFQAQKQQHRQREHSNKVAIQGILYVWAYLIVSVAFLLLDVEKKRFSHAFDYANAFISPLQGFLNVMVYLRPRYLTYRKDHPQFTFWGACWNRTMCLWCSHKELQKRDSNCIHPDTSSVAEIASSRREDEVLPLRGENWDDYADCEPSALFLLSDATPLMATGGELDMQDDSCGSGLAMSDLSGTFQNNFEDGTRTTSIPNVTEDMINVST